MSLLLVSNRTSHVCLQVRRHHSASFAHQKALATNFFVFARTFVLNPSLLFAFFVELVFGTNALGRLFHIAAV